MWAVAQLRPHQDKGIGPSSQRSRWRVYRTQAILTYSVKIDKVWATDINFWFGAPKDVTFELHDAGAVGRESRDATAMDGPVLSYGPVVLRHQDVDLLKGPHYLNDQIIEFFFHYLSEHNTAASAADGSDKPAPLLLVGPALAFWLLHCPDADGLKASIDPLRLPERELVLFALNNNEDVEMAEGGTHWTLLVYNRQRNVFEHFDSMSGTNWRQARSLVSIIKPFMGRDTASAKLIESPTPQQENCYDCGVYVMAIAEVICNAFEEKKNGSRDRDIASLLRSQVSAASVSNMRQTTLDLIDSLQD